MGSSPDSIPPGWEEAITSSPETLPPGFENPSTLSTPTSPPQENPSSSLPSPASPPLHENHVNLTQRLPSPSPSTTPPQESQSHQLPPFLKSPQENRGPLPHPLWPLPQETPVPLSPSLPPLPQEKLDAMPRPPLQSQDSQGLLPSSKLPLGNMDSLNLPPPQSLPEMGQMVCGSCNELLSYPRGSKFVQCACCQTANFVLEALLESTQQADDSQSLLGAVQACERMSIAIPLQKQPSSTPKLRAFCFM
ncbi:proline-rich receptor-like protein kinase PERK2 [Dendrobium catenatum]|uniref:proline-rich receptor-like protein kinase PERK2 n=1 Tax=Dendrobium catenatum TaxID=906689 RepID=UPI0009F45815|nr:proline-rich receptor-like protein kinase PERK2 [Dendrobium catenatum]